MHEPGEVYTFTMWDPDGPGPQPNRLVIGGEFETVGGVDATRIALWDGGAWLPLGSGMDGAVTSLASWDPDGSGPVLPRLFAGGEFSDAGGEPIDNLAQWDGASWHAVGGWSRGAPDALQTWDPDGLGPLLPRLIAAGVFYVQAWTGQQWTSLGSPPNSVVTALTTWDPDGPGPLVENLIAGGQFTSIGGVGASAVARWDGSLWRPLGAGLAQGGAPGTLRVTALTTWDPDGPGPRIGELIAAGQFERAGGAVVNNIARWDGSMWRDLSTGTSAIVEDAMAWDPDGAGPRPQEVVASGKFGRAGTITVEGIARWDGQGWHPMQSGVGGTVYKFGTMDPDGDGPRSVELVAAGIQTAGPLYVRGIGLWNGQEWDTFGRGVHHQGDADVRAVAAWDPDGPGPAPEQIVAGGRFTHAGGRPVNNVAAWDGNRWTSLGLGVTGQFPLVNDLLAWDLDGAGPGTPGLFVGGSFVGNILAWNGANWTLPGGGVNASVSALAVWDPDGPGPVPEQLVAGGSFTTAGGTAANRVATWDGSSWRALGAGTNNVVAAVVAWDPDGPGPARTDLVVAGFFTSAGAVPANRIARWDGTSWHALGTGLSAFSSPAGLALAVWDMDAGGPLGPQLVAGGRFTSAGGVTANHVARWDGSNWFAIGAGVGGGGPYPVTALQTWDPDGPGPVAEALVVGGSFSTAGGRAANRIALVDATGWHALGAGVGVDQYDPVQGLTPWDPDGPGGDSAHLVAGGLFETAADKCTAHVAVWMPQIPPAIVRDPVSIAACPTQHAVFSTVADRADRYQWEKDRQPLRDGPTGTGSTISGTTTPGLSIANISRADEGDYRCVVSNSCGMGVSRGASLTVCYADCDSSTGACALDVFDFLCFQNQYSLGDPAACDCDRLTGPGVCDIFDFICFQDAFAAGCP